MKASLPGSVCMRRQLGIAPEDPAVFRPVTIDEADAVARIVSNDTSVASSRPVARVGIIYDLMPLHVRPSRTAVARAIGITNATVRRREAQWELCDAVVRFDLVQRAMRSVIAIRASAR